MPSKGRHDARRSIAEHGLGFLGGRPGEEPEQRMDWKDHLCPLEYCGEPSWHKEEGNVVLPGQTASELQEQQKEGRRKTIQLLQGASLGSGGD